MNLSILKKFLAPIWGVLPPGLKYGKQYRKKFLLLKKTQYWSSEQLENYQDKKLRNLLEYAYKYVPYYKELFDTIKYNPGSSDWKDEFYKIPFLSKEAITENMHKLVSNEYDEKLLSVQTTGGTTGKQLEFKMLKGSYAATEFPFVDIIWSRVGYKRQKSRVAVLRNDIIPQDKIYVFDHKSRTYNFDTFRLTDRNIKLVLDAFITLKIEFLHTYLSVAVQLCEYIKKNNMTYTSYLKAVLATSENIYPGQRELIESTLNCRLFSFYGHSELCCIAGECEKSTFYHIQSEYGYFELIDDEGHVINEPNKRGEIVCTGFNNKVMPFIRYRTGDYASYVEQQFCECGRHYRLINNVEGRWTQEQFIGKDGNKISMTAVNMHSEIFNHVSNYQFEQNEKGKCILRIVKNDKYTNRDEQIIYDELMKKFNSSIEIIFEYVDNIVRTGRGKQRFIIQNINELD